MNNETVHRFLFRKWQWEHFFSFRHKNMTTNGLLPVYVSYNILSISTRSSSDLYENQFVSQKKRRKKDKITNQKENLTRFLFFLRRELERKLREDCWMAPHRQKKLVANWRPGEHNYFTPVYVCVLVRRWKEMEGFNWWYFETEIHL